MVRSSEQEYTLYRNRSVKEEGKKEKEATIVGKVYGSAAGK
jgi:hypothetical protein